MKIIYLGDWNESKNVLKEKILTKFGDELWFPEILYTHNRNIISNIAENICYNGLNSNSNSNLIIGCGLGAYFGHYISNITKIPSLLFNPSFYYRSGSELKSNYTNSHEFFEKKIILSTKDEIVDNKRVFKFLRDIGYDKQIKIFENMSHEMPLDFFDYNFTEFREKYKNFEQVKNESPKKYKITRSKIRENIDPRPQHQHIWMPNIEFHESETDPS